VNGPALANARPLLARLPVFFAKGSARVGNGVSKKSAGGVVAGGAECGEVVEAVVGGVAVDVVGFEFGGCVAVGAAVVVAVECELALSLVERAASGSALG
jgi:hypothetical protein